MADLDGDGDLDVLVNHIRAPAGVYRNDSPAPRVAVRLRGEPPNTQGIGAKVRLFGNGPVQSREVVCGGRYLSHADTLQSFAAGEGAGELRLEVTWPGGKVSELSGVNGNRLYEIDEKGAVERPRRVEEALAPIFEDASSFLLHSHHEEPFDDFARQPLLPRRLSELGPGVAWHDLDQDGDDDVILPAGKGGTLAVYLNEGGKSFRALESPALDAPLAGDGTAVVAWSPGEAGSSILVGISSYEANRTGKEAVRRWDSGADGKLRESVSLLAGESSVGPLALADTDGDGDLDLFVGGRVIPGRWPATASSDIYDNDRGRLAVDEEASAPLHDIGLVSGACFSDLDGDGDPDLVIALEWGPVTVLENTDGSFTDRTEALGLGSTHGLWIGVTTGDFDGDGRPDIVATNWGTNGAYRWLGKAPLLGFHADLDESGTYDVIEAYEHGGLRKIVPLRGLKEMMAATPFVTGRMRVHGENAYLEFARSSIQEILGEETVELADRVEARVFEHTLFLRRGDGYEARPLPLEAQLAPAFGAVVADLDGDGNEDLFLAQNFSGVEPLRSRYDAGLGLVLLGDGDGGFEAQPAIESGVRVFGEGRGAATADFDRDGRADLLVAQNAAPTRLYHNRTARPGLRVRLALGPGNPHGVGAGVQLVFEGRDGPLREVQSGSGYWSQSSVTLVLGRPAPPRAIRVRWPGGNTTETPVPPDALEIEVAPDGTLKTLR